MSDDGQTHFYGDACEPPHYDPLGHECDVADCEETFLTLSEVVEHERSHRVESDLGPKEKP